MIAATDRLWCAARINELCAARGLPRRQQAEIAIVVAELVSNAVRHGERGELELWWDDLAEPGLRVVVRDVGPGMQCGIEAVLRDWEGAPRELADYDPRSSLRIGLGAVLRLMDEVKIESSIAGTCVSAFMRWPRRIY